MLTYVGFRATGKTLALMAACDVANIPIVTTTIGRANGLRQYAREHNYRMPIFSIESPKDRAMIKLYERIAVDSIEDVLAYSIGCEKDNIIAGTMITDTVEMKNVFFKGGNRL